MRLSKIQEELLPRQDAHRIDVATDFHAHAFYFPNIRGASCAESDYRVQSGTFVRTTLPPQCSGNKPHTRSKACSNDPS